ncbi:NAC domain protein [Hibiscus syriacus]|uniref:NAC domain protein n=1 Tax=Hibiscus syriacus TaxID=106335 RepID=A0A6A3B6Z2_HIBSY|nr:NAC domain protein [Hibiscus syriacus]
MLGVGVFVTTGPVARHNSGPSVFISYVIAGISALLSSLCYTEFSVQILVAGGAFSYLRVTFGELVGYFARANILMEYVLSNAAVARSFTEYLCSAFGISDPNSWRVEVHGLLEGYNKLDFSAVALVLILTLCLCHRICFSLLFCCVVQNSFTKESSILNHVMTIFHVFFFGFIIIMSFCNGSADNLVKPRGLTPNGIRDVLDGAAIVYFIGSVLIVSGLYCLMALALCMMVPYNQIAEKASYSMAFQSIGWKCVGNVVGAGASLGMVASLLVAMLGQTKYLCVIGRARLVPSWLSKVHPLTCTPLNATLFLGICTTSIALFTNFDIVIEIISIGTLLVFYLVANALIYRKNVTIGKSSPSLVLSFLFLITSCAIGFRYHGNLSSNGGVCLFLVGSRAPLSPSSSTRCLAKGSQVSGQCLSCLGQLPCPFSLMSSL